MSVAVLEQLSSSLFRHGVHKGTSIAVGYMPVAFTFGLLSKGSGLSFLDTVSMSVLVFAGSAQYISLTLIASSVGAFEIILTTFIVNIRHLLMSAALSEKSLDESKWKKALYSFFITDEIFSVAATQNGKLTAPFMLGVGVISHSSWVVFSAVGYLFGTGLPPVLQESMGFALYALFIGLLIPTARKCTKVIMLAATAALINVILTYTTPMSAGWTIILSALVTALFMEMQQKGEKKANG